ncbi:MAG: 4'-phosphopantetheinyl transferase family protein, partial [Vulcanimicrobiaceae bacterium]
LAGYLGCPAGAVAFVYGAHGKPSLAPVVNSGDLRFSHSVTGDLALIGVAHAREIGVDVEREDPAVDLEQVRRRTLSPAENDDLDRLPAVDRRGRFFTIWTLKEAALKAIGTGLTVEPDQIEVRPARAGSPPDWTLASSHPAIDATRWRLRRVEVRAGHAAALAFEGAIAAEIVRRTIRDLT